MNTNFSSSVKNSTVYSSCYEDGYVRFIQYSQQGAFEQQLAVVEIENPQESLVKKIKIEITHSILWGRSSESFNSYFIPYIFDMEGLFKVYNVLCKADPAYKDIDFETAIGLTCDGRVINEGVFFHCIDPGEKKSREQICSNNVKILQSRILGKNLIYAEAALEAIVDAYDVVCQGFFDAESTKQQRMMESVGQKLQILYQRDHGTFPERKGPLDTNHFCYKFDLD